MFPFILSLFLLLSFYHYPAACFDGGCLLENDRDNTLLQVLFVIDRTKSIYKPYKKEIKELTIGFRKEIERFYRNSSFAASFFADWDRLAGPATGNDEGKETHSSVNACYGWHKSLKPDNSTFEIALEGGFPLDNGGAENTLAALAFAAADKSVGWIREPGEQKVRRVLVLLTDQEYYEELKTPGNRTEFKGDGTDTCVTSKPPTIKKVGEVLKQYQMPVIALLLATPKNEGLHLVRTYEQYFSNMPGVPFCSIGIMLDQIPNLHYDLKINYCFAKLARDCKA